MFKKKDTKLLVENWRQFIAEGGVYEEQEYKDFIDLKNLSNKIYTENRLYKFSDKGDFADEEEAFLKLIKTELETPENEDLLNRLKIEDYKYRVMSYIREYKSKSAETSQDASIMLLLIRYLSNLHTINI